MGKMSFGFSNLWGMSGIRINVVREIISDVENLVAEEENGNLKLKKDEVTKGENRDKEIFFCILENGEELINVRFKEKVFGLASWKDDFLSRLKDIFYPPDEIRIVKYTDEVADLAEKVLDCMSKKMPKGVNGFRHYL